MMCNSPTLYGGEYSREASAAQALFSALVSAIFLTLLSQHHTMRPMLSILPGPERS